MTIYFAEWNAQYEKHMINMWQANNDAVLCNKIMKHFRDTNLTLKRKHIPRNWFIKLHKLIKFRHLKVNDILVCNGFSISGFIDLIKGIQCHRVLILRDTVDVLNNAMKNKKKWLLNNEDFITKIVPFFDKVYSFDFEDCRKYNLVYMNQFLPFSFEEMKSFRKEVDNVSNMDKSCYFIGEYLHNRSQLINKLAPIFHKNGYKTDFNLIHYDDSLKTNIDEPMIFYKSGKKISYLENIDILKHNDIILEISQLGQTGITLRALEAILFNKKLITTNKFIKQYDFFSPEQIFILDTDNDNYLLLEQFFESKFTPIDLDILYKYSADAMLSTIKNSFK